MRGEPMLKQVGGENVIPRIPIRAASFPSPFVSGLEYSVPSRGVWNIVHIGFLVPEAHEIYVCGLGCLRGVVLTAAEMNAMDRFSTVAIEEHNVLDGDMEDLFLEGVTDILNRLPKLPRAVEVFCSCIHQFMGCDLGMCYRELRRRFPSVDFVECYMNPTMRKSGLTPDQLMRRQMYALLKPREADPKLCAVLGNCFAMEETSDLSRLIRASGQTQVEIQDCKTYDDYQQMGAADLLITTQPVAHPGGKALGERLGRRYLYLPVSYGAAEIRANLTRLAETLGTTYDGGAEAEAAAEAALAAAKTAVGETPIAIDYTVTSRPLGLARLLRTHGFRVRTLFIDAFNGEERADYDWLRANAPELEVCPTVNPGMRVYPLGSDGPTLALGQKAAYFTQTPHFVNLVENGGLWGFDGIRRMAEEITAAMQAEKEIETTISAKGLGCESCI